MIILQYNEIKSSFEKSIHIVGHTFNVKLYKRLHGVVSSYALNHIADELGRSMFIGLDTLHYGCILKTTHGLPYAYELDRYALYCIPLQSIHMCWTTLSFNDMGSNDQHEELSYQQEFDVIAQHFKELDVVGMITIKSKIHEIAYPNMAYMCSPVDKVKTKGSQKGRANKFERSTKHHPFFL